VPVQYSYTSTPPNGRTACTHPQCLYSTAIPLIPLWAVLPVQSLSECTVQLYHYSSYGPHCLYRAKVPVQYRYTSTLPMDRTACTEHQCLYSTAKFYSSYGPYLLYRASLPVQYSSTSTPLWAVLPIQSLSECTVQLYLYSSYGPYCLYRAKVPVQYRYTSTLPMDRTACTEPQGMYSTAIPLIFIWTVLPVQSQGACTVQVYLYSSYGRTACTEPQCLYSKATPLLRLWAVLPVQSLSECTVQLYHYSSYGPHCLYRTKVPVQYRYTSTLPMA
jgi:hypothetical protein